MAVEVCRANCCRQVVKWCILTTDILSNPALILTLEQNQNDVLIPTHHPCCNVVSYHSSFRYVKIYNTFQLIREFDKTEIVILIA
jgi:hypothetical protein